MKKLSLIILLVFAVAAGFAQGTDLTATYTFSDVTNYHTDTSPCDNTITGLTMGPMKKVGIISTSSKSNFRGRDWPTGTVVDTLKYIGFKITANSGYQFTVKKIQFGLGKSNTGPVTAEWRGSADGYATPFASDDYTLGNNITVNNGVLTISANSSTGNTLTLSGYSNITSCDFRLCFCNGPTNGTAGLQGPLTVTLDVQSTGGGTDPTITVTGTPLNDFTYIVGNGPSAAQSFSVGGSNLTGDISISAPTNYEVSTDTNPYSNTLTLTQAGGTVTATTINVRLVAGLAEGSYSGNVQCTSPGATAQNVSLSGSVDPVPSPTITITGTPLNDFTYVVGNGPSTAQTFSVSGANLDQNNNITITTTEEYEVSLDNTTYPANGVTITPDANGTVAATDIYVRLRAGLLVATYPNGYATVAYTGLASQNVHFNGSVTAPPPPGYFVDFDLDGESTDSNYNSKEIELRGINWNLTGSLIPKTPAGNDWYEGVRSVRFDGKANSSMTMLTFKPNGAGTISFNYHRFKNTSDGITSWLVQYTTDAHNPADPSAVTWNTIGTITPDSDINAEAQTFTHQLNTENDIRLRIIESTGIGTSNRRMNIDNISITHYPEYDFYNGVPKQVANDNITITGGDANYNTAATLGPLPDPNFQASFHRCLTLIGTGPWTINIQNQTAQWAAYKQGGTWHSTAFANSSATLTVPAAKAADIELLTGIGNNPTVPVTLSHFSATMTAENYVQLTWISQTETNLMGYNVYRNSSDDLGSARQICPMIAGTNTSQAQTYVYEDRDLVEDGTYYYWLQNVDLDGSNAFHGPVSVVFSITGDGGSPAVPTVTQLDDAYPNPFNPNTTIRYQLEGAGKVKINIYNTRGQLVRSFERGHDAAGHFSIVWDGRDSSGRELPSGVYLYNMSSGRYSSSKKMVLKK